MYLETITESKPLLICNLFSYKNICQTLTWVKQRFEIPIEGIQTRKLAVVITNCRGEFNLLKIFVRINLE